jgi:hypothetical protein
MEPKGSLPCSRELSTGPYPEPDESSSYHPILFLLDPHLYYFHDFECDSWWGFGLVTGFNDHFNTQLITTLNHQSTQTSVLSLLQSPLVVSWQWLLTVEILQLHQPSLLFTDSLTTDYWLASSLVSDRTENTVPLLFFNCFHGNVFVCEGITQ